MKRLLLVVACCVALSGCAARQQAITNLPTGITQAQVTSWDSAVAQLHTIATVNTTLRTTIIQLHTSGVIKDGKPYVDMLNAIAAIDQAQIAAANVLAAVPNNWTASTKTQIAGYIAVISTQLANLTNEGVIGIGNTNQQKNVSTLIGNIAAAANIIINLV